MIRRYGHDRLQMPFTGSDAEWQEIRAEQRKEAGKRLAALMRARRARGRAKVKAVCEYFNLLDIPDRIEALVTLTEDEPASVFWPIFTKVWTWCWWSGTHEWHDRLFATMQRVGPHASVKRLPDPLTIYRGCSRTHIGGLSWTTDLHTARMFTYWQWQGTDVRDPVVARARIARHEAYWYGRRYGRRHDEGYYELDEVICRPTRWTIIEDKRRDPGRWKAPVLSYSDPMIALTDADYDEWINEQNNDRRKI